MRLVVEEAQDHSACMEKMRNLYGADCVVVHSFRVDDRYRVVVALETASHERDAPRDSAVKNVVAHKNILWDTIVDESLELDTRLSDENSRDGVVADPPENAQQPAVEVNAQLLALAARIKALETQDQPSILEPESDEFRAVVFSDVLANAIEHETEIPTRQGESAVGVDLTYEGSYIQDNLASVAELTSPSNALVRRNKALLGSELSDQHGADKGLLPKVCTSEGAEHFASLLLNCVADSQKSLTFSGQSELKIGVGINI